MKFSQVIGVGTKVIIKLGDKDREFQIVSPGGSDIVSGRISSESPIAKSILGKNVGYKGKVLLPSGVELEICVVKVVYA